MRHPSKLPSSQSTKMNTAQQSEMIEKQYEMLIQSIASTEDAREKTNTFWITINTLVMSGVAYIRDVAGINPSHKYVLMWTLIVMGVISCIVWANYLETLKTNLTIKNDLLIALEKCFPVKVFTELLIKTQRHKGKSSLTSRILAVPSLFLSGYLFFMILLIFFPYEVVVD